MLILVTCYAILCFRILLLLVLLEMITIMYLELQIRVPYQFMTKMQVSEFVCFFMFVYKSIIYLVFYVELMSKCFFPL